MKYNIVINSFYENRLKVGEQKYQQLTITPNLCNLTWQTDFSFK